MGYGTNNPWLETQQRQEIFLFSKTPRLTLWPTQPPIELVVLIFS